MKKRLILILLGFSALLLTGCFNSKNPPLGKDIEVLNLMDMNWIDDNEVSTDTSNPYKGKKAYTLSETGNKLDAVEPHKYQQNNGLTLDVTMLDLTKYNKLVFTAKGDGLMALIIESSVQILGGNNRILYPLTIIEDTFEFSFEFEGYDQVLETMQSITIIFGSDVMEKSSWLNETPSRHVYSSLIEINRLEFTNESATEAHTFNQKGILYNPEDDNDLPDTLEIEQDWIINDEGTYIINTLQEGVQVQTTTQKEAWSFIRINLQGNYQAYRSLVIEVEGDSGARFKMKIEGEGVTVIETGNTANGNILDPILNGSHQRIVWSLSQENLPSGQMISFLIFFEPAEVGSGAQMIIKSIRLEK